MNLINNAMLPFLLKSYKIYRFHSHNTKIHNTNYLKFLIFSCVCLPVPTYLGKVLTKKKIFCLNIFIHKYICTKSHAKKVSPPICSRYLVDITYIIKGIMF